MVDRVMRFRYTEHTIKKKPHFDFRLEKDGVLKGWRIPKGLPKDVEKTQRLAISLDYIPVSEIDFQGTLTKVQGGSGHVNLIDSGTYELHDWNDEYIEIKINGSHFQGVYCIISYKEKGPNMWRIFKKNLN